MTARRGTARHRTAPVGLLRRLWVVSAVLTVAVLGGALAAGGTYALFSSRVTAPAGTVTSGTAKLDAATSGTLALQGLVPGASAITTATFTNTGTVPLALDLSAVDLAAAGDAAPGRPTGASLDELRLRATPVARATDCRAGLSGTTRYLRSWATPVALGATLAQGGSRTYCLEVLLDADAPAVVQGALDGFTLRVAGTQVRA